MNDAPRYHPSTDPQWADPFVDIDEQRESPVPHRYVHGGFAGTAVLFSFYLPPADVYEGRFFQHVTPMPMHESLAQQFLAMDEENKIAMSFDSGAAFVETNGGTAEAMWADSTIGAYKGNAAAAEYFRVIAREAYGEHRVYGYLYGGSGGGYRTIGSSENTEGVWDGFVPYVIGSPMAMPSVFCVRQRAHRILHDKLDALVDACEPGGVDPLSLLDADEAAAWTEVTKMGFPPRSWFDHATMGLHGFRAIFGGVKMADPTYFTDYWTVPGYEGADPDSSVHAARVQHETTVAGFITKAEAVAEGLVPARVAEELAGNVDNAFAMAGDLVAIRLASAPPRDVIGADLVVTGGDAAGGEIVLEGTQGDAALIGMATSDVLNNLRVGDAVRVDNSDLLAAQTYHRHQVPDATYAVWDQFRNADGTPRFPQRPFLIGPPMTAGAAGSVPNGAFQGKSIVVASLMDKEAYPWQADWYAARAAEQGRGEDFRLYYTERALHGDAHSDWETQYVSYLGMLTLALRDVAAWAESGVEPPASTVYEVVDGQVIPAATAAERLGLQPTVTLTVNGGERADVAVGKPVELVATADVPPGGGQIVDVAWDLDADGVFEVRDAGAHGESVTKTQSVSFDAPGTYFVTVRVAGQREGDPETPFGRLLNLARARVVAS